MARQTQAASATDEIVGSLRRATHLDSDTVAIPSRAAAWDNVAELRIATSRSVAFSTSEIDVAAASSMSHCRSRSVSAMLRGGGASATIASKMYSSTILAR